MLVFDGTFHKTYEIALLVNFPQNKKKNKLNITRYISDSEPIHKSTN